MVSLGSNLIRLNKLVASKGFVSRREADQWIAAGWVLVDGTVVNRVGTQVPETASVKLALEAYTDLESKHSIIFHKPLGVVSCQPEADRGHQPAIQLLTADRQFRDRQLRTDSLQQFSSRNKDERRRTNNPYRLGKLAVAGRLDINSTGLLLFTQSGRVAQAVIGPDSDMEKEYMVRVQPIGSNLTQPVQSYSLFDDLRLTQDRIQLLMRGVFSDGELLEARSIRIQNKQQLNVVLASGKHHHVRRMCEAVGWEVVGLKRVRIGPLRLANLPFGMWRHVHPHETEELLRADG